MLKAAARRKAVARKKRRSEREGGELFRCVLAFYSIG